MFNIIKKYSISNGLNFAQKIVDIAYRKGGLTDKVLDVQIKINELRHKHDISDKSKRIYEEFVQ